MKNLKKLLSLALALMLLLSVLPLGAMADNGLDTIILVADVEYSGNPELSNSKVYLHVFKNLNINPNSSDDYDITSSAKSTGSVTDTWVLSFLKGKYSAADSTGIKLNGLYDVGGNWAGNFVYSNKTSAVNNINARLNNDGNIHINVMLTNVASKTTSNASDNPKTGDTIFVPFMVMGLTATALAAAYVFGKKRIAR